MEKSEKLERRSRNYGREFFAFLHKKASVPARALRACKSSQNPERIVAGGCTPAGIRYVTRLADVNNYLSRFVPFGLSHRNSNAIVKYYGNSAWDMPMRLIFFLTLFFTAFGVAASDAVKIVAVVNDQIISSIDLEDRMALVMATTGIPDMQENRLKLAPQVLRQLINEKLQLQDATANSITVSDAKVHEAMEKIEKQNNKPPGSLEAFLDSKHVSKQSFYAQIRAQAAWAEIVMKKIRPKIRVSDQEVARYVKRKSVAVAGGGNAQEVMIATILLPVDSPASAASVQKAAQKLADEIHSGRSFEAIASQFSSGGGKAVAPFWVELSQLDPAIGAALSKIGKGGVTDPVKTESGYQLIKLVDGRRGSAAGAQEASSQPPAQPRTELAFKQVIITPGHGKKSEALLAEAGQVAKLPGQCMDRGLPSIKGLKGAGVDISFIRRTSDNLPEKVRDILYGLKVGASSDPVDTGKDIRVFMLCERVELPPEKQATPASEIASDEAARQAIYEEKLELEAQKYLRNLRREAFIEIRGM